MKKKLGLAFAFIVSLTTLAGCGTNSSSSDNGTGGNGKAEVNETLDTITLKNDKVSLSFIKENGSMTSFKNLDTETDFINESVGGNWSMNIDTSTGDCFESNPTGSQTVLVTSRKQTMTYTSQINDDGAFLTFNYDVKFSSGSKEYQGITVGQTISLLHSDDKVSFDYQITNDNNSIVITTFTGMQLSGIKNDKNDYNLFWPWKEGKIYEEAVKTVKNATDNRARMVAGYPVPFSLQLVQLYNDSESMFYYVKDSSREYKEFNFGAFINKGQHDFQGVSVSDKVSLSCSQYPFIMKEMKKLPTTVIGVSSHGDYYTGSDYYREFLIESEMDRDFNNFVKDWTGFSCLIGTQYGNKQFASYTQAPGFKITYPNWAEMTNQYGVTSTALLGWHQGGFDAMYPDYEFQTGEGFGEEGFRTAMNLGHNNGNTFLAYINLHIADKDSKWSNTIYNSEKGLTNILQSAIKTKGFSNAQSKDDYVNYMIQESYGTGTYYYAMCPASKGFQDAIVAAVTRLRKNGVDGIWFDQLMEMPAKLCYDKSHGHSTPATAYAEGYSELFRRIELAMTENGTGDYIFSSEGTCDAYSKWIDVCGYMWARPLGGRDDASDKHNMSPEITRYTMTSKFLGISGAGAVSGASDEFARAFVMCDPFLADPYKPSVGPLTAIYNQDSTYLHGRYMDMKGTTCTSKDLIYGLTISEDGKTIALNIYNYLDDVTEGAQITIDFTRLGLASSSIKSAINMFSGDNVTFSGNTINIPDLAEVQMTSILISLV